MSDKVVVICTISAGKDLKKLPKNISSRIVAKTDPYLDDPLRGAIRLQGSCSGYY